ncbi:MAG: 2,4-dihydroxyhept-2-ene-1,7-dioic acid aldolase, partial [Variovorax paradoxus]
MHAGMGPYFGRANIDIATLAMVETAQAMENLEDIVSVPGLDGIYIGPADLSIGLALGLPGPELHPELAAAMERVRDACERHGKVAAV